MESLNHSTETIFISGDTTIEGFLGAKLTCSHRVYFDIHSQVGLHDELEPKSGDELYCVKCGQNVQVASVVKTPKEVQIMRFWERKNNVTMPMREGDVVPVRKTRRKHSRSTPEDDRAIGDVSPEEGT